MLIEWPLTKQTTPPMNWGPSQPIVSFLDRSRWKSAAEMKKNWQVGRSPVHSADPAPDPSVGQQVARSCRFIGGPEIFLIGLSDCPQ